MTQLYGIFSGSDEDKYLARSWISTHFRTHQSAKPIETFAHIGRLAVKKILLAAG